MKRKSSEDIESQIEALQSALRERRAAEMAEERKREGRRHRLLGIKMEKLMATDASLRTRMEVEMSRFCTRKYDREVFGFGEPETWFARLARLATEQRSAEVAARSTGPASEGNTSGGSGGSAQAGAVSALVSSDKADHASASAPKSSLPRIGAAPSGVSESAPDRPAVGSSGAAELAGTGAPRGLTPLRPSVPPPAAVNGGAR